MMPRPDISRLGINYRRIPVLSIGRDVYLDTRLIIQKLEKLYPSLPRLGATDNDQRALERLLEVFAIDGGLFDKAVQLIPTDLPLLQQPQYYKDRGDFIGTKLSKESMFGNKPEALNEVVNAMDFMETTLLADGRDWILKTEKPSLADIEAIWPFHWLTGMPGALPEDIISASEYPKVFAWVARFQKAVSAAKKGQEKPKTLSGEQAMDAILQSPFHENNGTIDAKDSVVVAQNLKKGDSVTVWPTDTGSSHKDTGKLVAINRGEAVFETVAGSSTVHVHAPRHGFRVKRTKTEEATVKL
jgi:glutathione S-transferase